MSIKIKNVVIVDDNESKREDLMEYAKRFFSEAKIYTMDCANEFVTFTCQTVKDKVMADPEGWLLMIDMQMPRRSDSRVEVDMGYNVLRLLEHTDMECPVIIVSSESIDESRAADTYSHYKGFVRYSPWRSLMSDFREVLAEYLQ